MKRSNLFMTLASVLVIASLALTACGGGATTEAPQPTKAPAPTSVPPTTAPQPTKAPEATATQAGCAAPAGTSPIQLPASGAKVATGSWTQEPDNVVPYYTVMSYAVWIAQLTLVGLAEWDDKGNFVPELAADVPTADNGGVSKDGLTITWHLKDCLYWSDGERLTSKDVKFTWEQNISADNASVQKVGYDKIDSIDTPDDLTVVIHFKELFPPWQVLFTQGPNNSGSILPAHILEGKKALEKDPFIHMPTVASGPFVITDWVAGDHMTLLPNPNFYKGRAKLDQVNIKFIPDPETTLAALRTGDVDWYPDFSESDISTVGALEPDVHLLVVPGADFEHYFFNLGATAGVAGQDKSKSDVDGFCPFKDVRVRKAIILGIDRQTVVETLLEGKTVVPASQWPNSSWTNTDLKPAAYDPDAAMKLLDDAGYKPGTDGIRVGKCDGKDVKLSFGFKTTTKQIRVDIALAAQADLKKIGIEFKPEHMPAGTFFGTYSDGGPLPTGNYDMAGYTTGYYPDPYPSGGDWLCDVPSKDNPGGTNNYHDCDPDLVKLFEAVNATADPAARKVAIDAVQKYIYDNSLVVMMYARANVYGYVDRFVPGPFGFMSNMNWNAEVWDVK
jgi:peptide/nickel transport system substrate-binding protein